MARPLLVVLVLAAALLAGCEGDPETTPTATPEPSEMPRTVTASTAIPVQGGTFKTLLGWVPEGYYDGLALGDIEAWRELVGIEAPETLAGERDDILAQMQAAAQYEVSPFVGMGWNEWYFMPGESFPPSSVSARTSVAFGFGMRDVDAFATKLSFADDPRPWTIIADEFDPAAIEKTLAGCRVCQPGGAEVLNGTTMHWWGKEQGATSDFEGNLQGALPLFDVEGRGGAMAFFDDHVIRTSGADLLREHLRGPMLRDREDVRELGEFLDGLGLLYAQFAFRTPIADFEDSLEAMQIGEAFWNGELPRLGPYVHLAVGGGYAEGDPFTVVVIPFAGDDAHAGEVAASNVDIVRQRLEALPPAGEFGGLTWGEFLDDYEVTAEGRYVVVRARGVALGGPFLLAMSGLFFAEPVPQ